MIFIAYIFINFYYVQKTLKIFLGKFIELVNKFVIYKNGYILN